MSVLLRGVQANSERDRSDGNSWVGNSPPSYRSGSVNRDLRDLLIWALAGLVFAALLWRMSRG
jgi:hypothetical protein